MSPLSAPPHSSAAELLDSLLVTMALEGDRRAAARLHARWHPRLLRTAHRQTGEAELAIAAVQDCWLAIWRGLPRLRDSSRFAPWAFGILRRRCAEVVQARARERAHHAEPDEAAGAQIGAGDDRLAITQAFATLGPTQRLAAHLFFVEGLTLTEIAEVQQVPAGTVKSRLFHARRQLKLALSGESP